MGPLPWGQPGHAPGGPTLIQLSILEKCQHLHGAWPPNTGPQQRDRVDTGPGHTSESWAHLHMHTEGGSRHGLPVCRGVCASDRLCFTGACGAETQKEKLGVQLGEAGGRRRPTHTLRRTCLRLSWGF